MFMLGLSFVKLKVCCERFLLLMAPQYDYKFQVKFWDYMYHYLKFKVLVTKLNTHIEYAEVTGVRVLTNL